MTKCESAKLMLPYLCDVLDPAEQEELRNHLAEGCEDCAAALAEARSILGLLPLAMEPVVPPATAHCSLMKKLRTQPKSTPQPFVHLGLHWLTAGLVGAAIATGVMWWIVKR